MFKLLTIVVLGLGLMTGIVPRHVVFRVLGSLVLFAVLSPFIPSIIGTLPLWLVCLLGLFFAMSVMRRVLTAGLGGRAADHTVGILAADAIRFLLWLAFAPVRMAFGVLRALL